MKGRVGAYMCYEVGARPPASPVSGGAGSGSVTTLTSADGTQFAAFSARTEPAGGPGVVILPDVRGLHGFYHELALRFAEAGVHATAIDYFGRTAGAQTRGDDFEFMPHVAQTTPGGVAADVGAAVAHVRSDASGAATSVFTIGFCFGGRASFNQAAADHGLSGVIGFYGRVGEREPGDSEAPVHQVSKYTSPVLGLFGGADQGIPKEDVEAFRDGLDKAGISNEIKIYDGAPHSFFDRSFKEFAAECDDAWSRILAFTQKYS